MTLPEITEEEKMILLYALGTAFGVARDRGNFALVDSISRLADSLMRNDPNWRPCGVVGRA